MLRQWQNARDEIRPASHIQKIVQIITKRYVSATSDGLYHEALIYISYNLDEATLICIFHDSGHDLSSSLCLFLQFSKSKLPQMDKLFRSFHVGP